MNKKGFTLVELMVAMLVLSVILISVYRVFFYQERTLRRQRQWSALNMKGRKASTYIAKEIRLIGYCQETFGGTHAFGIVDGGANGLVYSHDVYGAQPGRVDNPADIHSITLAGNELLIDGDFACENVASLNFVYNDVTEAVADTPVTEVDVSGNWILAGNQIENIEYTLKLYSLSPVYPDTVVYNGIVSLRNRRP